MQPPLISYINPTLLCWINRLFTLKIHYFPTWPATHPAGHCYLQPSNQASHLILPVTPPAHLSLSRHPDDQSPNHPAAQPTICLSHNCVVHIATCQVCDSAASVPMLLRRLCV